MCNPEKEKLKKGPRMVHRLSQQELVDTEMVRSIFA